jgi:(2R)-phospho-3-sulfolactate synthase (ComA)
MESLSTLLQLNRRAGKPRSSGLTEIRGPYYSVMGSRYLSDLLETMGAYVDSLKFAGGSFCLMPEERVREFIDLCHRHDVLVSTGGFLERVLPLGANAVDRCLDACRALGFDTIEVSSGFVAFGIEEVHEPESNPQARQHRPAILQHRRVLLALPEAVWPLQKMETTQLQCHRELPCLQSRFAPRHRAGGCDSEIPTDISANAHTDEIVKLDTIERKTLPES